MEEPKNPEGREQQPLQIPNGKNEKLAKEELEALNLRRQEQVLYEYLTRLEGKTWQDDGKQSSTCRSLIYDVDYILSTRRKLSEPIVKKLYEVGEKNPTVAFVAEAFKEAFSEEGKEYCKKRYETHKKFRRGRKFWGKMVNSLIDQREKDSKLWILPEISFDSIHHTIDNQISRKVRGDNGGKWIDTSVADDLQSQLYPDTDPGYQN